MLHCLLVEKRVTISSLEKSLILEYNVLPPKMGNLLNKGGDDGGWGGLNQTPESGSAPYHRDTSSQYLNLRITTSVLEKLRCFPPEAKYQISQENWEL